MKPTAVRASKPETISIVNNTTSSAPIKTVCSTPNKNQSSHNASPAIANSTQQIVSSGAPTIPPTSSTTSITSSNSSSSSGVTPSQQIQAIAARDENHSHVTKTISTRGDQQPIQNSIIPTTAPVAFAAVAKHSSSQQHTANEGKCTLQSFLFAKSAKFHTRKENKTKQNERRNK